MAVFEVAMTGAGDYRFRVIYTVTPQGNFVSVAATSEWQRRSGAGGGWSNGAPYTLNIGGSAKNGTRTFDGTRSGPQWIESHEVFFSAGAQTYITATFDTGTDSAGSGSIINLTVPLNLATQPTFTPDPASAGSAIAISLPRTNQLYTHDLIFAFGSQAAQPIVSGAGVTHSWTPPLSLLSEIPNATSGQLQIGAYTKQGSTTIGYRQVNGTLVAPASVKPTCSGVSVLDLNGTVASVVGKPVQGLSRMRLTVSGAGIYGSTIKSAEAILQGVRVASGGEVAVTSSGPVPVSASVTDSRGRVGTWASTLEVLPYEQPKATGPILVRRCNSTGVYQEDGTYLRVDVSAAVKSLVNGTERNSGTIRIGTRERGSAGGYTPRNVITFPLNYGSWFLISGGSIYAANKSWDVLLTIEDKLTATSYAIPVGTAKSVFHITKNGNVAIGKRWEQGAVDVGGPVYAENMLLLAAASWAETKAGTRSDRAVTPSGLESRLLIADLGPSATPADYPMGSSLMFAAPQASGWPIPNQYGNVRCERSYFAGGGSIRYWSAYTGAFAGRIWFQQWVYQASAWGEWQELAVRGQNGTPWMKVTGRGTSSASGAVTVTFPAGKFTQPPTVTVTPDTHANVLVARRASAVTTTSFQVQLFTMPGAAPVAAGFEWEATQMTAGSATG